MPNINNPVFAFGVLIAHAIWSEKTNFKLHKLCEKRAIKLKEQDAEIRYLIVMLNRNGVRPDEFDLIALPSIKIEEIDQD